MKNSQKDLIRRMQKQDALGISRKKREYLHIDRRLYRTVKIAFAVLIPVMFFLYSLLLILVMLAYFVTVCIFNVNAEKEMNENYRSDCHVKMPRYDLIVTGIVLGVTVVGIVLSEILSRSAGGMLGGFSDDELEDFIGSGKFPGGMSGAWFRVREILTDLGSLMTGERSLFFSFRIGMQPPPGGFDGGGGMPDISLSDLPLSFVFSTLFSVLNSIFVFAVAVLALFSLRSVKKVYRIADSGHGRSRNKLRFEPEELHSVERDMEEIRREQDMLLKIFEDELLEDGEPSEEDEAPLKESAELLEGDEKPSERGGGIPAEEGGAPSEEGGDLSEQADPR